jgi:hypothetical protein
LQGRGSKGKAIIVTYLARFGGESNTPVDLIAELNLARSRIDRATQLMSRALDLREQLEWGGLDLDDMAREVADFTRDAIRHKRGVGHA